MKFVAITLSSLFLLIGQSYETSNSSNESVACSFYDFSKAQKVCHDQNSKAWQCSTCQGSITAISCLLVNSKQLDPDTVDCQLGYGPDPKDTSKMNCLDEHKLLHSCTPGYTYDSASCQGCRSIK